MALINEHRFLNDFTRNLKEFKKEITGILKELSNSLILLTLVEYTLSISEYKQIHFSY